MMGRITPPKELPAAIIPKANARFLKNQVVVVLIAGSGRKSVKTLLGLTAKI
jgi:hypothetical protein